MIPGNHLRPALAEASDVQDAFHGGVLALRAEFPH